MSDSNLPDDIRNYDSDPRSPYYDDGGYETWSEERTAELWGDCADEVDLDLAVLHETVTNALSLSEESENLHHTERTELMGQQMVKAVTDLLERAIEKQVKAEWDDRSLEK